MSDEGVPQTAAPRRALALGAAALGFLVAVSWAEARDTERATKPQRERLARLVAARQAQTEGLEARLAELRGRLDRAARGGGRVAALQAETERLAFLAGGAAAAGPGIVVTLTDGEPPGGERSADHRVQDVDLQLVANALWAAGAEAIAINGERVVTTTAIRSAGAAILVNFRVLTSPYRVSAIGDPGALRSRFSASDIAERFRRWSEIYGLGLSIRAERSLRLPAFAGSVRFRYATPVDEGG